MKQTPLALLVERGEALPSNPTRLDFMGYFAKGFALMDAQRMDFGVVYRVFRNVEDQRLAELKKLSIEGTPLKVMADMLPPSAESIETVGDFMRVTNFTQDDLDALVCHCQTTTPTVDVMQRRLEDRRGGKTAQEQHGVFRRAPAGVLAQLADAFTSRG